MAINKQLKLNKAIQILLLLLFTINVSGGLFTPILAVFVTRFVAGATLATVGFAVALYAAVKSIIQVPLAQRLDRKLGEKDDFYAMLVGSIVSTAYVFGFLLIRVPFHLYVLSIIGGVGAAFLLAAYYGIFARHVDRGMEGLEWSLFSTGGLTISVAIGGAIGGIMADAFGFRLIFLVAGALSALATILLLFLYPFLKKKMV